MRAIVVDASVAVKWFLNEAESERAAALLAAGALHAPALLRVEVAAAISRRQRIGALDEADARRLLIEAHAMLRWPAFRFVDDNMLLPRAAEIALQMRHPLQDCLYVACAEQIGGDVVTVDPKFVARIGPSFSLVKKF